MTHVVVWVPRSSLYRTKVSGERDYQAARATAKRWAQSTEFNRDDHLGVYSLNGSGCDNLLSIADVNDFVNRKEPRGLIQNGYSDLYGDEWGGYYPRPATPVKDTAVIVEPPKLQAAAGDKEEGEGNE